ncbi:thiolase family protein [Galbitalea soli]|uniref:Probable acetyl-CoA acetyltransferase n=1 Tax=Galbitalea soli TaxID=1268042 RepID=A0A7C9PMG6_9MICO|nr:thiolase family protein [Galbitalea soli]NEM90954.1 thiolase family protein [Galbitalea soli]NYJ29641.1 acetyl-CoA C-acetyltransferase [Galbitalea soli]
MASAAPVVVAAYRTPITTRGGRLATIPAEALAAPVIAACADEAHRVTGRALDVGDVILGNCMGPGGNIARLSALAAGLPVEVPGMTVDRQCGSGLAAIVTAAESLRAGGDSRMIVAGGVESASTAPTRIARGATSGYARAAFAPEGFPDPEMGPAAQALAALDGISREAQDAYADRSHRAALAARAASGYDAEIVAVGGVTADDGPRAGIAQLLGRFPALYPGGGTVTAGNSTRISDGAAAVALVAAEDRAGAPGLALIASATVGCDPALPGLGPVGAVRAVLERAGVTLDDLAAIEIVEAFSAQTLAVLRRLGLAGGAGNAPAGGPDAQAATGPDPADVDPRVCAGGGALALGHPWGASGAVVVVRLFSRLVRAGAPAGSLGLATAAVGGGMGVAALFEVVR